MSFLENKKVKNHVIFDFLFFYFFDFLRIIKIKGVFMETWIEKIKEYKLFLGLAAVGLVMGGVFLFWPKQPPQAPETVISQLEMVDQETSPKEDISLPSSSQQKSEEKTDSSQEKIMVDVKGAVRQAGVYELPVGSRVYDAVQKAGGMTDEANSQSVNLAQKLEDESIVYVAKNGEEVAPVASASAGATGGEKQSKDGKVNLNTATEAELQTISGIGQKRAQDIIAYREGKGKFQSVDELKNVSGIGQKTLEKLKEHVTVD